MTKGYCADHGSRAVRRMAGLLLIAACGTEPSAPAPALVIERGEHAQAGDPDPDAVSVLLDSFSIGGVYTILPRGGYSSSGTYSTRLLYSETVNRHPTGIELPEGLPVRVLAQGVVVSTSTQQFHETWCAREDPASQCGVESYSYSVFGLVPGPGVFNPYGEGTGLRIQWSRTAPFEEIYGSNDPSVAQLFRGVVPPAVAGAPSELLFRRLGCCYIPPLADGPAFETYEGSWRFGVVPDDGGRSELGISPTVVIYGPRTDAAMSAPATFRIVHASGTPLSQARWWFIRPAANAFDGLPVSGTLPGSLPRYPEGQRAVSSEIVACAGLNECEYQADAAGAIVAMVSLADATVLAARNTGLSDAVVADLVLSCTALGKTATAPAELRVPRGTSIECFATTTTGDASVLTIQDWTFVADGMAFRASRAESGTLAEEPLAWRGETAVSGTVTVVARIGLEVGTRSAAIPVQVDARPWANLLPSGYPTPRNVGQRGTKTQLPDVPEAPADLGKTEHFPRILLREHIADVSIVTSGPNSGLAYLVRVPLLVDDIEIMINDEALRRESVFWFGQPASVPTISNERPCTQTTVTSATTRRKILEHEGLAFEEGSHTQRFKAAHASLVGPAVESLAATHDDMSSAFETLANQLFDRIWIEGRKTDDFNKIDFQCSFNFDLLRRS